MSFSIKAFSGEELTHLSSEIKKQIQDLDHQLMDYDWTDSQWKELWYSPRHYSLAILESDRIQGFSLWLQTDVLELLKIAVMKEVRGTSQSQIFFSSTVKKLKAQQVFLEVSKKNNTAINFYKKLGFETLNEVKRYYRDGSNCLKMSFTLTPENHSSQEKKIED